ncbi:MAG: hypothetical protein P8Y81_14185 [Ignavibacteriaceae bacterium]
MIHTPVAIRTMEDNFKKLITESGIDVCFDVTPHTFAAFFCQLFE